MGARNACASRDALIRALLRAVGERYRRWCEVRGDAAASGLAAEIVAIFDRSVAEAKKVLSGFDDAAAMGAWTLLMNGRTIFSMPRVAVVRNMLLNHAVHHRGQLSVFLRLLDVPVPGPYGPSADENPFA